MTTPPDLLAAELRRDGTRPMVTWYDAAAGARVELSVTSTANWVAKTSGYLADDLCLGPGDSVPVRLPLHWLAAVLLLAVWSVGADPDFTSDADLPLDPLGAGLSGLVAAYPDAFVPAACSGAELLGAAPGGLPAGARVLTTVPLDATGVGWGLLAPLAAGGSVVYAPADAKLAERAGAEHVTHTVGAEVPGLPRLG